MLTLGITLALLALFSWGFGDFFIQRTTRAIGIPRALFFIGFVALIVLFPFVQNDLPKLFGNPSNLLLLIIVSVIVFLAAIADFEALKIGKLAIIDPIVGLELPITIGISIVLWHETLTSTQIFLTLAIFAGIMLAITEHHTHLHYHKRIFEKGVVYAGLAAVGMALVNFLIGVASQKISPLVTIWFTHGFLFLLCGAYLVAKGELKRIVTDLKKSGWIIAAQSIFDNAAWIFYAFATTYIPISIAIAVSESYIALAVLLGVFANREKLKWHQYLGIVLATIGVISLSLITEQTP
ncbi:DMT family transporter [Candidatus Jorgensenbacteria bacterium]|nr:DMT family transporter [Candidatus Jorgensenbacteria bacterium]